MHEIKVKSIIPIYLIGLAWVLCTLILPMYRWYDFIIALIVSIIVYRVASNLIPQKTVLIESEPEPISTGNTELDEVLTTGTAYMTKLNSLNVEIANEKINKQVNEMMRIARHIFDFVTKTLEDKTDKAIYELLFANYCKTS